MKRTCWQEYKLGLWFMLVVTGLCAVIHLANRLFYDGRSTMLWVVFWAISLVNLIMLVPVIPGYGQMMCLAIAKSLTGYRAAAMSLVVVLVYYSVNLFFTKAFAVIITLSFGATALLTAIASFFKRRDFGTNRAREMGFFQALLGSWIFLVWLVFSVGNTLAGGAKVAQFTQYHDHSVNRIERLADDYVDYRGEVHVHSYHSHDSKGKLEDIAKAAKKNGISWIVLTDHEPRGGVVYDNRPAVIDGVLFIFGSETGWGDDDGSQFNAPLGEAKEKLHLYGHVEKAAGKWREEAWDGFEIVNFHANALERAGSIAAHLLVAPVHGYDDLTRVRPENMALWQELAVAKGKPVPIFAGPDAHSNVNVIGEQFDPYDFMLGLMSTHIFLKKDEKLDEEAVIRAIKEGRTYVCFDYLGDPTGFEFMALKRDESVFIGGTIERPVLLAIHCWCADRGDEVRLFRDNQLVSAEKVKAHIFISNQLYPGPGFWRVELWRNGKPWIISGQILVK